MDIYDIFLPNKYTKIYYQIITRAVSREIPQLTQKHHIVPKSLGGSNNKTNLVHLTFREHFIAHWLLTKMCDGDNKKKMHYAFWAMGCFNKQRITSQAYAIAMKYHYETITGRVCSIDTRRKISRANKGKQSINKGKSLTQETKLKMSISAKANTKSHRFSVGNKINRGRVWDSNVILRRTNSIKRSCSINGVVYASGRDAAQALNIKEDTIYYRLKSTSNKFKDYFIC